MGEKRGCLKNTMFGCLGLLALLILFVGGTALVALTKIGDQKVQDTVLSPTALEAPLWSEPVDDLPDPVLARGGRVKLDLGQGGFEIHPARRGQPLHIEAKYDEAVYKVEESFEILPDSTWVYTVRTYQTISGLHALFRQLMGAGVATELKVYLPDDVPIALEVEVEEGGFEAELGGLWITAADIHYQKGGFELGFDEPTREPMEHLVIRGRMGGFEASRLGNASPRVLDVRSSMGGADVDLTGDWARDCDIRLAISMGGMSVRVPEDLEVQGLATANPAWRENDDEVPLPTLRFTVQEKMGEIEILYR